MATTHFQLETTNRVETAGLHTELEAAAHNARNLLHIANRELLENVELGLSLVAAAERYISDIIVLNSQLSSASATITCPNTSTRDAA